MVHNFCLLVSCPVNSQSMTCFSIGTYKAVVPLCSTQMPATQMPASKPTQMPASTPTQMPTSTPTQMPPDPVAASTHTQRTPAAPAATSAQPQEGMLD